MKKKRLRSSFYFLKIIWEASPGRVLSCLGVNILHHLYMFFSQIIFVQYILNAIQQQRPFQEVILIVALMGAFAIIFRLLEDWYTDSYSEKTNHIIYAKVSRKIFEKSAELELRSYEDPEFYDSFIKAAKESREKILTFMFNMAEAISCVFSIILTGGVMLTLDPVVIIFSLLPLIISYTIDKKLTKLQYNLTMDNVSAKRREDYVQRTIYLNDYAKEYRLFPVFKVMLRDFKAAVNEVQGNIEKYGRRMAWLQFCSRLFKRILIPMGSMLYIVFRMLISKALLIGDGLALINAVRRLTWMIYNVTDCVIKFQELQLYADNLKQFLEYTPQIRSDANAVKEIKAPFSIEFCNVSFTYPGQTKPTLQKLNLSIREGEQVCIVGRNGAGKTTLIKLLLRLYDPDDGAVLVNGIDIRKYELESYRQQISTVFQDSRVFALSIAENILAKTPENPQEREVAEHALQIAGFEEKLGTLPDGIDTVLSREFDDNGVSLSGGQNQKLAIARAFARSSGIMVFDEPSSALDPISEYNLYQSMRQLSKDKTVLFISHRLSSAVGADKVFLLDDGKIAEQGSHEELMEQNGVYAGMFRMQAESYVAEQEVG